MIGSALLFMDCDYVKHYTVCIKPTSLNIK